jgi:amino acid adenylation domain-containing protein
MTTEARLPDELTEDLHRRSAELGVPAGTLFLVAHAKVLAVLGGVDEVTTSYVTPGDGQVPFQLALGARSWRSLLQAAARVESDLGHGIRTVGGSFDVELVTGPDSAVLLRVHHRSETPDEGAATRVLGYHLTALTAMVSDLDARHDAWGLVGPEETVWQVEALAGPRRRLPDVRAHDLIAARAASHPDAVAAVHGEHSLTYRELDTRANQIGNGLLAAGLRREEVVAVVAGRDLPWLAAVLGVLKAGGVYLPVEPNLPAERVASMLTQSRCRLVLTEPGTHAALDGLAGVSPDVRRLDLDTIGAEHPGDAVDVRVDADQLAYIFFTSGSTGRPKGAMCDHAGMLNHLLAKIEDLGIAEGTVVAQTAPQSFDISLWQLIAGPLAGGRTLLVDDEAILDVDRFLDTVIGGRVEVLQLVPSYLDVVLGRLEQRPRVLPDLRCVSVTGEAVPSTLVRRWFAALPDLALVNAYGLTETHDDTNHEVLRSAPPDDRIPLGRALRNVHVYVVDDHLRPVPFGAPGEIVFSGVCVGRGYVNDPERTRAAFLADPLRPGERLYRSGDRGRWRPDGKLEFLGRADSQVKVRGFRIELGDVEAALSRVPGVTDAAVVVAGPAGGPQLAGFFTGAEAEPDVARRRLAETLPAYMVPSSVRRLERLPLTPNGKVDKGALRSLAGDHGTVPSPPISGALVTPAEGRVAAAWAQVLELPVHELRPDDDFFLSGGTSLAAVRLVAALDRSVTLRDVRRHPVLRDLARQLERGATASTQEARPEERTRL